MINPPCRDCGHVHTAADTWAMHQPRRVHVVPGREAGDWITTRIPNARRKGWI